MNKIIKIILFVLFLFSLSFGIVGYLNKDNGVNKDEKKPVVEDSNEQKDVISFESVYKGDHIFSFEKKFESNSYIYDRVNTDRYIIGETGTIWDEKKYEFDVPYSVVDDYKFYTDGEIYYYIKNDYSSDYYEDIYYLCINKNDCHNFLLIDNNQNYLLNTKTNEKKEFKLNNVFYVMFGNYDRYSNVDEIKYLIIHENSDKYSVTDLYGNYIVEPNFDMVYPIDNDNFLIIKDKKYGVMNLNNEYIFNLEYDGIAFSKNFYLVVKDNKLNIYTKDLKQILDTPINLVRKFRYLECDEDSIESIEKVPAFSFYEQDGHLIIKIYEKNHENFKTISVNKNGVQNTITKPLERLIYDNGNNNNELTFYYYETIKSKNKLTINVYDNQLKKHTIIDGIDYNFDNYDLDLFNNEILEFKITYKNESKDNITTYYKINGEQVYPNINNIIKLNNEYGYEITGNVLFIYDKNDNQIAQKENISEHLGGNLFLSSDYKEIFEIKFK